MSGRYTGHGGIDTVYIKNYLSSLVNRFFKILPIREENEQTLVPYMESLLNELIGCEKLMDELHGDPVFMSLLGTLQYLIDHPDSSQKVFRREVFKSISICNRLRAQVITMIGGAGDESD